MLTPTKVYLDARRMAWFAVASLVGLMAAALALLGRDAVPILSVGLPILGVIAGGYVGIEKGWGIYDQPNQGGE